MNLPMSWLRQYVDVSASVGEYIEDITMSGSKVESVKYLGNEIRDVVVGKIISISKHPNADKLSICKVDVGKINHLQIITGATNVFEGAYVPVALNGAELAGGKKILRGEIRGESSDGMLCSIEELGSTRQDYPEAPENGIYIFNREVQIGGDAVKELELLDEVVEFEITSNRPDCFSILGLARETAATYNLPLKYPKIEVREQAESDISQMISVEIKNPELCPRYIARVVKNVVIEPSPQWMRHRLTAAGIRPINNIVDITNYVMLEFGQPMHAFDIDNIFERKIIVRNACDGEEFTTLDGTQRKLDSKMLVISDCNKAIAIAGIMGGENSKVTSGASAILFESANFDGTNIRLTSKKLGLRTDSSSKYEKGIDPNLALAAINRAVQLVEELGCGEVAKGCVDCYPRVRVERKVEFSPEKINRLLGTKIEAGKMAEFLNRLEIKTEKSGKSYFAIVPTFRPDLEHEADLAEEVARLYGYNNIETTLNAGRATVGKLNLKQKFEEVVHQVMVAQGFMEAMNYSFESPKVFDKLNIEPDSLLRKAIRISNPLGEDYSIMRTLTVNGMLNSLSTNYNRRNTEAWLYELANVYLADSIPLTELPRELKTLTIGMYGNTDFFLLSGMVEQLLERLGIKSIECIPEKALEFMHPGRTAKILTSSGIDIGYMGEVHPFVLENYEIGCKAYLVVINLSCVFEFSDLTRNYTALPRFPGVSRDISLLVHENVTAHEIENVIRDSAGEFFEEIQLFDVYKGKQIQDGFKSMAYSLSFRAYERSLTDDEVSAFMKKIVDELKRSLKIQLRDK